VTGSYYAAVTFGSTTLACSGGYDVFVAKMDPNGNWLWAKRAYGTGTENGTGIAVDASGNVYITGYFNSSTLSFASGISLSRNSTSNDGFVAKLNSSGTWLWARKAGGAGNDQGMAIALDASGNAYVGGIYTGTAYLYNLTMNINITPVTSPGYTDLFVAQINPSGVWQWAASAGGSSPDNVGGIAVASDGSVYLTGSYNSSVAYFGNYYLANGYSTSDVFVAKLNDSGDWLWARKGGGSGSDGANGIALDNENNIYISGNKEGTATFGSTSLPAYGGLDIFAAKLDAAGNWLWAKRAGGSSSDMSMALAVDSSSGLYLTGSFMGTAVFGTGSVISTGGADAFMAKMDLDGNWLSVERAGGPNTDMGWGVATDPDHNVLYTGTFAGTMTIGGYTLTSNSESYDIYFAKNASLPLLLTSPVGGEYWIAGTTHNITWSASSINAVNLYYSIDAGQSWTPITSEPVPAGTGTYAWTLPSLISATARVKVSDASNPDSYSASTANFTIYIPLTLESPEGGEQFIANTTHAIQWDAYNVSQVMLDYSLDAGSTWMGINSTPISATLETYDWTLPDVVTDQAKVRIRDYNDPSISDMSDSPFTIYIPLVLESPNGGPDVTYLAESVQPILWDATNVAQVLLDYSLDAGTTWMPIITEPIQASLGTYDWTLPDLTCFSVKIRVRNATDSTVFAQSTNIFGICQALRLQSLNGGSSFEAGSTQDIVWDAFTVQQVRLDYSTDSGVTWEEIVGHPLSADLGSYAWTMPDITDYEVRVRVRDSADPNTCAISTSDFAIIVPPTAPTAVTAGPDPTNAGSLIISWDPVLTNEHGDPITPDGYYIYYSTVLSNDPADFTLLATVTGTTFIHQGIANQQGSLFYKIVAFKN
jgi:hypothetical protein